MKRTWIGKYFDIGPSGNEKVFIFRIEADLDESFNFKGTVWEEDFYEKSKLSLSVKGFIDDDHISFVKTYPCSFEIDENFNTVIDLTQKGHEVIYDGYWNNENNIWEGTWEIKSAVLHVDADFFEEEICSGRFEMKIFED